MAKHHGAGSSKSSPSVDDLLSQVEAAKSRNDLSQARRILTTADKLYPKSPHILTELGNTLLRSHQAPDAEKCFRQVLGIDPDRADAAIGLLQVTIAMGRLPEAEDLAREIWVRFPNNLSIGQLFAQTLIDQGRIQESIKILDKVVETHPTAVPALNSLAKRLSQVGEFEASLLTFERAIQLDPSNAFAYLGWVQAKRITASDIEMLRAIEINASNSKLDDQDRMQLFFALGKAFDDLGKYETAMGYFREANLLRDRISDKKQPFQRELYEQLFELTYEIFTEDTILRIQSNYIAKPTPIFIIGMFRSGTTLVEQILSSHSRVNAGGEIQYWLDISASCFDHAKRIFDFPRAMVMRKPYQDRLRKIGPMTEFVTDKMPGNYRVLGLLRILFPRAKFIHCVRNPIDTCLSIYMTAFNQPPNYASDPHKLVVTYRLYERFMTHWKSVLGQNGIHEVRYEDLVRQPEEVTRAILEYCNLDFEPACLRPEDNIRSVSTASLWQARQPVYQSATEKWRRYEPWIAEFLTLQDP